MATRRTLFGALQGLLAVISFAYTLSSLLILASSDFEGLAKLLDAESLLYVFIGLGGVSSAVGLLGLYASCRKSAAAFKFHFVVSSCVFLANLGVTLYLILFVNDVEGVSDSGSLLAPGFNELAELALKSPEFFSKYQNETNCCGVGLQTLYNANGIGANPSLFDAQLTGSRCDGERSNLLTFVTNNPLATPGLSGLFASAFPLLSDGFFCGDVVLALLNDFCSFLASVLGAVVLVQLIVLGGSSAVAFTVGCGPEVFEATAEEFSELKIRRKKSSQQSEDSQVGSQQEGI